ncbi:MAG TPA: methyltransferase domain-containing protein [Bryobacteraceae bacterium]|jgi:SAM-dependent methyltransferase
MAASVAFSSSEYWEGRYRAGGTSGMGSVGRLARFKAATINRFIADNAITSVVDLGCGDASQLELLQLPADYVGVDVSPAALASCTARFPGRRFVQPGELRTISPADLTMALDVIYHLIEDSVFAATLSTLFSWATRFVVIYASNLDAASPSPHVRHRRFTDRIAAKEPDWRLLAHLPNPYPYDAARPDDTSFSDFFIYGRNDAPCSIVVPART